MGKWLDLPETLLFEVRDNIAYITFNRPEKRNAQNITALRELNAAMMEADDLSEVRCIVLQGNGKDFCAGADLDAGVSTNEGPSFNPADYRGGNLKNTSGMPSFEDDAWGVERSSSLRLVMFDIHKPVIAKLHGHCLAVGTDIAFNCDLVIAADDARIGFPATRSLGSPANHMWTYHMGPQWAKRMLLTGDFLLGKDAVKVGLVLQSFPGEELDDEVHNLAKRIALVDPALSAAHKRIVNLALELMGQRSLQRLAAENDARAHLAPGLANFVEVAKKQGLKVALKERDGPFGDPVIKFRD